MRAYSQDGEGGDVFAWGQDDFDRDDAGDAEDVEFEDFAASSTPEEVCAKITAIAIRPFFAVLGMDVPDGPWAADFDPMTIELSPQPLPGAFEYELAADTRAAVLTALPGAGAGAAAGAGAGAAAAAPQAPLAGYRLPTSAPTIVRLHDPRAPFRYPRITALLNHIHCHLTENRVVTNRGLYYLLATSHPSLFPSPASVTASLQDVVRLLRCSRRAMGITTSGRGLVCGKIKIKGVDGVWRDYSTPDSPDFEVPGDINAVVDGDSQIQIRCDASYFLIVEKHSVFDKLKRERIWGRLGIVLITAKGFPDLPTRAFVKRLQTEFPNVPTLGLVDWNPSGVLILKAYRHGSARSALESAQYALHVKWLGVCFADLASRNAVASIPLTERDRSKIRNLLVVTDAAGDEAGRVLGKELREMTRLDKKAEIESLYPVDGTEQTSFAEFVVGKIVRGEYV